MSSLLRTEITFSITFKLNIYSNLLIGRAMEVALSPYPVTEVRTIWR